MKRFLRIISIAAAGAILLSCAFSAAVSAAGEDVRFSQEYMSSPYYERLLQALDESEGVSVMERTLAAALSQEGYLNYATEGIDVEEARAAGLLWTGAELRMNSNSTGNTEYTRWAQSYLANGDEEAQYADFDWCAIFMSWCMYQAGYYSDEALKRYFYSYSADPRIFFDADSWLGSFNCDQQKVWYVPKAHHKLDAMDWNTYYNVDVDPYDIPYRPGGLIFFSWDASGEYFDHVAIVVDYDAESHELTYCNGNWYGQVMTCVMDLDDGVLLNGTTPITKSEYIMAYSEYESYTPPEQRELRCEADTIVWDVSSPSGLKIQTDSQGVTAAVYIDGNYHGSIIESNMIFHEGLLSIGRSELSWLDVGRHSMKLVFDDGVLELTLIITDTANSPLLTGDADLDGEVSVLDVTAIQRHLADIEKLSAEQLSISETDGDGEVTILDATMIQRYLAGIIDSLV